MKERMPSARARKRSGTTNRMPIEHVQFWSGSHSVSLSDRRTSTVVGILSTAFQRPICSSTGSRFGQLMQRSLESNLSECNLKATTDVAIIGAGPYGLSLAAHLRNSKRSVRIFGSPMHAWARHMPQGMHLKSEGFASDLYDPEAKFTLKAYCSERAIPYADIGLPVAIETFIAYGLEFQRRYAPDVENVQITSLKNS